MTTAPLTGLVCIAVEQTHDSDERPLYCARFVAHEGWGDSEWGAIKALAEAAGAEGESDE
jgi:hypothetical protein